MAYNETDWISKEKRELFCKAVNSILMTKPDTPIAQALDISKRIVDTAFTNYPDPNSVIMESLKPLDNAEAIEATKKWQENYNIMSKIEEAQKEKHEAIIQEQNQGDTPRGKRTPKVS